MMFSYLLSPLVGAPAISMLLKAIVETYLTNSYCLTIVSEQTLEFNFAQSFTYVIPNGSVDELTEHLLLVSEDGCSDYIVRMKDPKIFMIAYDKVNRLGTVRRSDKKIIILPHSEEDDCRNQYLKLLTMKAVSFVNNLLIILPTENNGSVCKIYDLITNSFGSPDNEIELPVYLDRWNSCTEKFIDNTSLFPRVDMSNLNGKTLKVACFTYKPYVLLNLDPAVEPTGRDGVEMRIVEEFCRWVNCTIKIILEDKDQWGEIFDNGTGIGILGSVAEDRADVGIAALYSWYEEFLYLDFSAACIRAAVTCIAPAPRLLESWEMPFLPFTLYMWYAVLITVVLASVALGIAKGCTMNGILLTIFGIMISQSQRNVGETWRVRSVTGWLLVATLILISAYGAGLASTFTVPKYEASIDMVKDLVDRDMEWGATHNAWIFSLSLSNEPIIKKLVSQFKIYSQDELKRRSFTRDMAFSIEKLPAGHFAIGDYLTKEALLDLALMIEDFYYEQCVVMLRKNSPYTEKLSSLVGRLHQSGLILAWETQVALKHLNFKVQQELKLSRTKSDVVLVEPLSLRDVVGIFILFISGILLSVVLFVLEVFHKKNIKKKLQFVEQN